MTQKKTKDSPNVTPPPPVVFLTLFGMSVFLEQTMPLPLSFPLSQWVGLLFVVLAFGFALPALAKFLSVGNALSPNKPSNALVTNGVYRFTRNPMYLAALLGFVGLALLLQSLWVLLATAIVFLYLRLYVIPREEAYMTRTYGKTYQNYCQIVRRWF